MELPCHTYMCVMWYLMRTHVIASYDFAVFVWVQNVFHFVGLDFDVNEIAQAVSLFPISSTLHRLIISDCLCHLLSHGAHICFSLSNTHNTHVNIRITRASTWQLWASQIACIVLYCLDVCTCRKRICAFVLEREHNSQTEREASIGEKTSQPVSQPATY